MNFKAIGMAFVGAALAASTADAQYFSQNVTNWTVNQNGTPFWDKASSDNGVNCNIGFVLTGQTSAATCNNYKLGAPNGNAFVAPFTTSQTFWTAHEYGAPATPVGFYLSGSNMTFKYYGGIAGANPLRQMAIQAYDFGTGSWTGASYVFDATNNATWTYSGLSGFFRIGIQTYSPVSGTVNAWSAGPGSSPMQLAAFGSGSFSDFSADCGSTGCWFGGEDVSLANGSDGDYQDGILSVTGATVTTVPEPMTLGLVGTGLAGMVGSLRRRNKKNQPTA